MKKEVFDFLKENPGSNVHQIAKALRQEEIKVLRALDSISSDGCVCLYPSVWGSFGTTTVCYRVTTDELCNIYEIINTDQQ